MSDDEETMQTREEDEEAPAPTSQGEEESDPVPDTPKTPTLKKPPHVEVHEGGKSEAELIVEEKRRKDAARQETELEEYYEMRKEEKERIENEIAELKEKRAERLNEREEEERKMAEQRSQQEDQRRAEEAERQRKKQEESEHKREEREAKRIETEERAKNMGKKNFVITRKNKSGELETVGGEEEGEEKKKTPEQVEAEKRAALEQRIAPLGDVQSMDEEAIKAKAKELHQQLVRLESEKYDLDQTYKQRQYEMNELAERARSMNKGGHSKGKKTVVSENVDPLAEKYSGIPPKILLCSKYERHTDRRTYVERKDVFSGPIYGEEAPRILPGEGHHNDDGQNADGNEEGEE